MKITLRELFLLTVIVGLVLGWWIDRWRLQKRLNAADDKLAAVMHVGKSMTEMLKKHRCTIEWYENGFDISGPRITTCVRTQGPFLAIGEELEQ